MEILEQSCHFVGEGKRPRKEKSLVRVYKGRWWSRQNLNLQNLNPHSSNVFSNHAFHILGGTVGGSVWRGGGQCWWKEGVFGQREGFRSAQCNEYYGHIMPRALSYALEHCPCPGGVLISSPLFLIWSSVFISLR